VDQVSADPGALDVSVSTSGPNISDPPGSSPEVGATTPWWMWGVLLLFFAMHIFESVGRWLLEATLPPIKEELKLSESEVGWLSTIMLLGLATASVPIGYLADRLRRPRLIATGFAVWSVATVTTGLARTYDQIQIARALVGIGSATFEVVALTILLDLFPRGIRARVLAVFFLAVPMGAAVGLSVAGALAWMTTWQTAFLVVGAPGLVLALTCLLLPDPVRGLSEGVEIERLRLHERVGPSREDYIDLMVNSSYTYSVFGITFSSFALAGLVYLSPTFLTVAKGLTEAQAASPLAITYLGAAVLGTAAGAWLADPATKVSPRVLFVVPGLGMIAAIPFTLAAIYGRSALWIFGGLFLAEGAIFMNVVPCYAIIASVVMPNMRAVACGAALASIHLLGDIWSPTLIDWAVDTFGQADSMATIFGKVLTAVGAVPVAQPGRDPENLTAGMFVVIPALLISGIVLLAGARHLPREMALMLAKLRATPTRLLPVNPGIGSRT
jgi:MFS transporter, Spinster family, sphingosine-1-phosphate transporter